MKAKIFKNGYWKKLTLKKVRLIEKTKFSDVPQFVWEFEGDDGFEMSKWTKTFIPLDSAIGQFIEIFEGDINLRSIEIEPEKFKGKSAEAFISSRTIAGEKKQIISRFREIKPKILKLNSYNNNEVSGK